MYIHDDDDQLSLVYTAGLFDGEGSIVIGCSKRPNRLPNYWLQVGVTNTDKSLVDWLRNTFGGHTSDNSHSPSRKLQRPCWAWRIMGNEAKQFLKSIQPYLRVKREQSEIAIEFQSHMAQYPLGSNKHAIEEYLALREKFRASLRALTLGKHSLLIESQIDEDAV